MSDRPLGVTLLAIFQVLGSFGALFVGWVISTEPYTIGPHPITYGIVVMTLAMLGVLLGYGLFMLKPWAWVGMTVFQWFSAVSNLINFITQLERRGGALGGLIISLVIIYYLYTPTVKRAFCQR